MSRERHNQIEASAAAPPNGTWLIDLLYDELDVDARGAALARVNADPALVETLAAYRRVRAAAAHLPTHPLPADALERALAAALDRAKRAGGWWRRAVAWWRATAPGPALASALGAALVLLIAVRVAPDGEPRLADAPASQALPAKAPGSSRADEDAAKGFSALSAEPRADEGAEDVAVTGLGEVAPTAPGEASATEEVDAGAGRAPAPAPLHETKVQRPRPRVRRQGGAVEGRTEGLGGSSRGSEHPPTVGFAGPPGEELDVHADIAAAKRARELDSAQEGSTVESQGMLREPAPKRVAGAATKDDGEDARVAPADRGPERAGEARWRELRRRVAEGDLAEAERLLAIIVADEGESAETRAVEAVLLKAKASPLPARKPSHDAGLD